MENLRIIEAFKLFDVPADHIKSIKLTSGTINNTYKIIAKSTSKSYILQKINTRVFPMYDTLMNNISVVSDHIQFNLKKTGLEYTNLKFYPSKDGKPYVKLKDNSIWRLSDYIENNKPEISNHATITREAGKILGTFHYLINDLNINLIKDTLPDFHNLNKRWQHFITVIKNNNLRLRETKPLLEKILKYEYLVEKYNDIIKTNSIPTRIIHNDPKLSNILFKNNIALCLIDPDTIMQGYLPVDFGDSIRSLCNTSHESEKDLSKVDFNFENFKIFSTSYLKLMKNKISNIEIALLPLFSLFITFEQLIRFYSDFLEGDIYYHTKFEEENLIRTKVQLKLLERMSLKFNEMNNYIESFN